jgi:nucleoside 2-deoxyribosyltransferase
MADADLKRPYDLNLACSIAEKDLWGVKDADVLIIIGDQAGTGMYVELGIALATNTRVYSIGDYNDITVFHFLAQVSRLDSFEEVLEDLH